MVVGLGGSALELLLLEHYEPGWQLAPFVALGAAGVALSFHAARRGPGTVRGVRAVMTAVVGVGLLGIVQHYGGNRAFELEMNPDLAGWALVRESLHGATPVLAPGLLVQLGLLGLLFTLRHPRLRGRPSSDAPRADPTRDASEG